MIARAAFALLAAAALAAASSPAATAAPATWKSRMAAAERYAESRAGTISFAVVDESGRLHGYHARAVAPSASVLKAMLLVAYLRRSDVRDRALQQWEKDLLEPMIRRSDNVAATRMVGLVGERRLDRLARVAGMEHFRLHWPIWGASEITPRGQALYFHRIDRLVPPRHRAYALRLLATIVPSQRWGVGRVEHGRWQLYFKGGWGSGTGLVDHQVALYRSGAERFSLALFTRFNPDHEYGKETLRGLAARFLEGVPLPGQRLPRARDAALGGRYVVTVGSDCGRVSIRPEGGEARSFATGAPSCAGFKLASARGRALWAWAAGGESHLATAAYGDGAVTGLGDFDATDELGALAGSAGTLAYQHGDDATVVGGPDCPSSPAAVLAVGRGGVAIGAGSSVEIRSPDTCALVRSLSAAGKVRALAVGDDLAAVLSRSPAGRVRLERFRISTGVRLGVRTVETGTVPALALRGRWLLYRTSHALRVLATGSGRAWTVWRPKRAPVAAGFVSGHAGWVENHGGRGRLWSLRLPGT